jgi:RNA polymerase sigma-70 factor (ECF subfamily)
MMRDHFDFVWRSLRRIGLDAGRADDAAQEVFLVAARKIDQIEPGRERSFLFGTALRIAADARRAQAARRESAFEPSAEIVDPAPSPEALVDQLRARRILDDLLDELADDARVVFVLYEFEELEMSEIAELMSIPQGTVASKLRRARETFSEALKRRKARATTSARGGNP